MDALKTLVDTELNGKVSTAQGVANEGKILQVNGEGNLALVDVGSAVGTNASDVSYENASYPSLSNVSLALTSILNQINYIPIAINSLSVNPSTLIYEIGVEISSLVFNWSLNKTPTNQTFNGTTVANDTTTFTYDTPFSTNKTFTLNVSDSEKSAQKSINIQFQRKIYWGNSSTATDFNSAFILGLPNEKFSSTNRGTFSATCGNGEYFYICYPNTMSAITSFWISGFEYEVEDCGVISFTNASGNSSSYRITRSTRAGLGSITVDVT